MDKKKLTLWGTIVAAISAVIAILIGHDPEKPF